MMNGWIFSGLLLVGAVTPAFAQEIKRAPAPPVPVAPAITPRPFPTAATPAVTPIPQRPPLAPSASTVSVQGSTPQPFPAGAPAVAPAAATAQLTALKFDAEKKEYTSKPGEVQAPFTFLLTNVSYADVSINAVRTSCGCTVAKLPATPWVVSPGQGGPIEVSVNLAGKGGTITKSVTVETTAGVKQLLVTVNIAGGQPTVAAAGGAPHPTMGDAERLKNMQLALADRQVLFKNQECAKCHAEPAKDHMDGAQLYAAVCSTCHDSPIRAAMVPDLRAVKHPTDADYWRNWITYGRAGSMMPAFAQAEGGPLSEAQIGALVNYMVQTYSGSRLPAILQQRQNSAAIRSPSVVSPSVAVPAATTPAGTPARTIPPLN